MNTKLILLAWVFLFSTFAAAAQVPLRGRAALDHPLVGATVSVVSAEGSLVARVPSATNENGAFEIAIDDSIENFSVEVNDGTNAVWADMRRYNPDNDIVFANAATTLVHAVMGHCHWSLDRATKRVQRFLKIPVELALGAGVDYDGNAYFSQALFMAEAAKHGGFHPYVERLAFQIRFGWPRRHAFPNPGAPAFGEQLIQQFALSLVKSAGSKIGGDAAGWIMKTLFGAGGGGGEDLEEIKRELADQKRILQGISAQITELQRQINDFKDEILNAIDRANYEAAARSLQIGPIATIQALMLRLTWLTTADPAIDHKADIAKLNADIKDRVLESLTQIHNILIDTPGARGLIPFWQELVVKHVKGYPRFLSNDFLRPVNEQYSYYFSFEVTALALIVEAYHADTPPNTDLAKHYVDLFTENTTAERKLIPHDTLTDDGLIVDMKNKKLWFRHFLIEPIPDCPRCSFYHLYDFAMAKFKTVATGGYHDWRLPTAQDLAELSAEVTPPSLAIYQYLDNNGFQLSSDIRQSGGSLFWSPTPNVNCEIYDFRCGRFDIGAGLFLVRSDI